MATKKNGIEPTIAANWEAVVNSNREAYDRLAPTQVETCRRLFFFGASAMLEITKRVGACAGCPPEFGIEESQEIMNSLYEEAYEFHDQTNTFGGEGMSKVKEFKSVCYEIKVMMDSCEEREIDGAFVSEVPLIRAVPDKKTNSVRVSGLDSGECEIFFSDSNNFATGLKKLKSLGCR